MSVGSCTRPEGPGPLQDALNSSAAVWCTAAVAADQVIIHQACSLHEGVHDGRSHESHPRSFKGLAQSLRLGCPASQGRGAHY